MYIYLSIYLSNYSSTKHTYTHNTHATCNMSICNEPTSKC